MRKRHWLTTIAATVISMSLATGCSLFGPRLETITVSSEPPGASVVINGMSVGHTPLRHQVRRAEDLLIEVRKAGFHTEYRSAHRTLSTIGIIDVIGGAIILVPFFGLLSSAAWKHEPSTFGVVLAAEGSKSPEGGASEED